MFMILNESGNKQLQNQVDPKSGEFKGQFKFKIH